MVPILFLLLSLRSTSYRWQVWPATLWMPSKDREVVLLISSVSNWTEGCPWLSPSPWVMLWASTCRILSLAQFATSPGLPSSKPVPCVRWQTIALADCCLLFFYFLTCLRSNSSFLLAYRLDLTLPQLASHGVLAPGAKNLLQQQVSC